MIYYERGLGASDWLSCVVTPTAPATISFAPAAMAAAAAAETMTTTTRVTYALGFDLRRGEMKSCDVRSS